MKLQMRGVLLGLLFGFLGPRPALARTDPYPGMIRGLKAAESTGRVKLLNLGRSAEGRSLPLAVLGSGESAVRVMVLCGQHGDEPVSPDAALRLVRRYASGDPALHRALRGACLMLLPMVNPDGIARGARANGAGIDLNRDWKLQSQPETRAVYRAILRYRPQAVLDAHEWTVQDHQSYNSLESGPNAPHLVRLLQRETLSAQGSVTPLAATAPSAGADGRLAHRYLASRGIPAFLLETAPSWPGGDRRDLYARLMVRFARSAARHLPPRPFPPDFVTASARAVSRPAPAPEPGRYLPLALGAVFGLLLLVSVTPLRYVLRSGEAEEPVTARNRKTGRTPLARLRTPALRLEHRRRSARRDRGKLATRTGAWGMPPSRPSLPSLPREARPSPTRLPSHPLSPRSDRRAAPAGKNLSVSVRR